MLLPHPTDTRIRLRIQPPPHPGKQNIERRIAQMQRTLDLSGGRHDTRQLRHRIAQGARLSTDTDPVFAVHHGHRWRWVCSVHHGWRTGPEHGAAARGRVDQLVVLRHVDVEEAGEGHALGGGAQVDVSQQGQDKADLFT